ncbi:ADP-ribosylglycohydrolase family protein [Candidatus Woesearchaeota archaeon]|nr:ADP-ribosylglycohydrolase family protein [Candidatus Woesearchaeota archaeon]MBW3018315.1 ADP-ribosylglycohydrolase family protein [Candidatus Woesearchaeota archaeon]
MYNEKEDRAVGCIIGAAVGDAIGAPTEYISSEDLSKYYGGRADKFMGPCPSSPCKHLSAGQYTDDTQQLIALAESLVRKRGFSMEDFGKKLAYWGKRNQDDFNFCRFPGGTSMRAAAKLLHGGDPRRTGSESARTCGSAMRVAPVGVMWYQDLENLVKVARQSSVPTHNSTVTRESCAAVAATIGYLMNGYSKEEAIEKALDHVEDNELYERIRHAVSIKDKSISDAIKEIGTYEAAIETVPFAFYAFAKGADFRDVVAIGASACPGDTDSIACIAGSMAGAFYGYSGIPDDLKGSRLEDHDYLVQLGEQLLNPFACRIEMHSHTRNGKDCAMTNEQAITRAKEIGLDGIAITEHMSFEASESADNASALLSFPVIRGAEYHTDKGHFLIFGIDSDEVFRKFGKYGPAQEIIDFVVEKGGVAIPSHPYKKDYTKKLCDDIYNIRNISAVEVLNGQLSDEDNKKGQEAAAKLDLPGTGGSDAHCPGEVGVFFTEFENPVRTIEELVAEIKKGKFKARNGRVLLSP